MRERIFYPSTVAKYCRRQRQTPKGAMTSLGKVFRMDFTNSIFFIIALLIPFIFLIAREFQLTGRLRST